MMVSMSGLRVFTPPALAGLLLLGAVVTIFPTRARGADTEAALIAWGHTIAMQGNGLPGNTACAECHRINGGGMPSVGIPRIAGQTETYIYREIRGVQKGTRYSPYMDGIVQNLSRRDIRAVALYYSTVRTPKLHDPAEYDPSLRELGRRIAHRGLWDRNIPACILCHGQDGRGIPPNFPYIAGQSTTYLTGQLISFAVVRRKDDPEGLMRGIASKLTHQEIKAVAQYFASLDPPVYGKIPEKNRPDRLRLIPEKETPTP
ncbi:MAG: c-type cytochrome [Nitrospirae bacterium]|nr:c-type cytochrome [Nitrospirota bacterium]